MNVLARSYMVDENVKNRACVENVKIRIYYKT